MAFQTSTIQFHIIMQHVIFIKNKLQQSDKHTQLHTQHTRTVL